MLLLFKALPMPRLYKDTIYKLIHLFSAYSTDLDWMRCTLLFSTQIAYIFCILSASHIINSIRWIFIKIWTKWKTSLSLMAAGNTNTNTNNVYIKLIPRFQPLSLSLSLPLCLYHSLSHSFVHYNCNTSATTFVRGAHLAIKRAKCSVNFIRSIPNKLDRQNLISHTLCQPNKKKHTQRTWRMKLFSHSRLDATYSYSQKKSAMFDVSTLNDGITGDVDTQNGLSCR